MNSLRILFLCVSLGLMSFLSVGCPYDGPHYPTTYGVPTSTPTLAPLAAAVTATASNVYSPSSVTILHGGSVTFFSLSAAGVHSVYMDNGANACVTNYTSFPVTVAFPTVGTFNFHCYNHSFNCLSAACGAACTG